MPIGVILLFVASVLVFFGLAQRILDHLKLSDLGAVMFLVAMIAGSFLNIPILRGRINFSLNVGGGILPIALGLYLLLRAGTTMEWGRALLGAVITGGIIWGISQQVSFEPGYTFLDPMLIFGVVAGIVGYLAGRSRRGAFVAATWGLLFTDLANMVTLFIRGNSGRVVVGGAGVFDTIVLAGFLAVTIAEVVGETREHMAGGPEVGPHRPQGLHDPDMEMSWEEERSPQVEFADEFTITDKRELWDALTGESTELKESGFPSQLQEAEIVQEIYGNDADDEEEELSEEPEDEEVIHDQSSEGDPCSGDEQELLEAIFDLATDENVKAEASGKWFDLGGGVVLSFEEAKDDEA